MMDYRDTGSVMEDVLIIVTDKKEQIKQEKAHKKFGLNVIASGSTLQ